MAHTHHCLNVFTCRGAREAEALPEELSLVEASSDVANVPARGHRCTFFFVVRTLKGEKRIFAALDLRVHHLGVDVRRWI